MQAQIAANRLDEATKTVEALRQESPDSPFAETYLGVIAAKRADLPAAREHFTKALAQQPSFAVAVIDLAQTYRIEHQTDEARAVFDRFLKAQPANVTALLARAALETSDGKADAAVAFLERARSSDAQALQPRLDLVAGYVERKNGTKAIEVAHELETLAPGDRRVVAALAEAQLAANDRDAAIRTLQRLIGMTEGAPEPQIRLAQVYTESGDVRNGYRLMREALQSNPTDPRTQKAFFDYSIKNDMVGAGTDLVSEIARRRPDDPSIDLLLGQLYEGNKRFERAAAAYQAGLATRPSSELVLGLARSQAKGPQPATALVTLANWLEKEPEDRTARFLYANLLTESKQYNEATRELERLLVNDAKNPVLLNNLAWVYFQAGDGRASSKAEEAYALAPNSPAIAGTLGWVLVEKGELRRGTELLRKAAEGSPNPSARYHLAVALSRSGQHDEALRVLTALIGSGEQFDDLPAAQALIAKLRG